MAEQAVDEALRTASATASAGKKDARLSPDILSSRNAELESQVRDYSASIAAALKIQGRNQDARLGRPEQDNRLTQLDRMLDEAKQLTDAGRHGESNRVLAGAYHMAVTTLSELRAGETVILELKFDTPADEYAYEQRRNQSHEMLVEMMIQEGRGKDHNRGLIDNYLLEDRQLRSRAEAEAAAGNYAAAIKSLEEATGRLVRALRLSGMMIF